MTRHFSLDIDRDGIATLALDVPGAPLNILSDEFVIQLDESIRALSSDAAVRGILVTSAKAAFADADLLVRMLAEGWIDVVALAQTDYRPLNPREPKER